jgi:hypothetical protein
MGKAASQRRIKRLKYLVRIEDKEPERFEAEWERSMSFCLDLIRREEGGGGPREVKLPPRFLPSLMKP